MAFTDIATMALGIRGTKTILSKPRAVNEGYGAMMDAVEASRYTKYWNAYAPK